MYKAIENAFKLKKKHKDFVYSVFNRYRFENSKVSFDTMACGDTSRSLVVRNYRTNTNPFMSREDFIICIMGKNKIEIHSYDVLHEINFDTQKESFDFFLKGLRVYENDQVYKYRWDTWEQKYVEGTHHFAQMGWHRKINVWDLDETDILNSPLRYTGMKSARFENVEHAYKNRNQLERLHVAKMHLLHRDLLESNFNKRILTQRRIVKYRKQISKHNLGYGEAVTFCRLRDANVNVDPSKVWVLGSNYDLRKSRISASKIIKLTNYLSKQKRDLSYYTDYLSLMDDINASADTEQTLYPKDLTAAHDKAVSVLNMLKREVEIKLASEKLERMPKFNYRGKKYTVVVPTNADDLIQEGKSLDHCVGGSRYIEGHFGGKFTILFIRKSTEVNTPYYTMTLSNELKLTEVHGKGNVVSKDERLIKQFLSTEYLPYIQDIFSKKPKKEKRRKHGKQNITSGSINARP